MEKKDGEVASCITFQTEEMRVVYGSFLEVLCLDVTHGTNHLRYKLFSFVATDAFGDGQFVQHALIEHETTDNVLTALRIFKKYNPGWGRTKVAIAQTGVLLLSVFGSKLTSTCR